MKSFFQMNFQNGFRGDVARGFRPLSLGQDDVPEDQNVISAEEWVPPTFNTTPTQTTTTQQAVPKTTPTRPAGSTDEDWAKILATALKEGASGYGVYTKAQIEKMKAEADLLKAKNPSVARLLPSDSKTATIALVAGGAALLGLILVVALK